jgi:hypothetical protein
VGNVVVWIVWVVAAFACISSGIADHLLAFEITSVVLLVAAVGSVILGAHAHARGALVERGKEAGAGT